MALSTFVGIAISAAMASSQRQIVRRRGSRMRWSRSKRRRRSKSRRRRQRHAADH